MSYARKQLAATSLALAMSLIGSRSALAATSEPLDPDLGRAYDAAEARRLTCMVLLGLAVWLALYAHSRWWLYLCGTAAALAAIAIADTTAEQRWPLVAVALNIGLLVSRWALLPLVSHLRRHPPGS